MILGNNLDELRVSLADSPETLAEYESILTALEHLPPRTATTGAEIVERQRDKQIIKRRLRELAASSPPVEQFIAKNIAQVNGVPNDPASFDRLDALRRGKFIGFATGRQPATRSTTGTFSTSTSWRPCASRIRKPFTRRTGW